MIINSILIENFRCYYGINELDLNNNGKITLIYGKSGYGKSSLIHFLRWIFYGDPDFGPKNDKPLFNEYAYKESKPGKKIKVSGKVDFEHLGTKYCLTKTVYYDYALNMVKSSISKTEYSLQHLVNDSWQRYDGDIANKIKSILPQELSKYFFLEGEKAREVVLNSVDLKKAIYRLFQLDAYVKALEHIGNKSSKKSVLGIIETDKASKITNVGVDKMTPSEMQTTMQDLWDKIEHLKKMYSEEKENSKKFENEVNKLYQVIGKVTNKETIGKLIKSNSDLIDENTKLINSKRRDIGNLFYSNYPYLFLSKVTSKSASILREQNEVFSNSYKNVFEHLQKELLKEVLEKGKCICDRKLDDDSKKKINNIIKVMPPDSYSYQFGQFVSISKRQICSSQENLKQYDEILEAIATLENKNAGLREDNKHQLEELQKLDNSKKIVEDLENAKALKEKALREAEKLNTEISKLITMHKVLSGKYEQATKNSKVSKEYQDKIDFFKEIGASIYEEKNKYETQVNIILDQCIREIFKKLTTQKDVNVDKIKFIKPDFSLRETYLTGGQLAIDVYSYVIGIIKALQECDVDSNENPIIIDAPFAFTDNIQSEHIFETLPSISKQTVLLTLDLNKIKNLLGKKKLYDFYIIDNKTQEKAKIIKGDINDIE